MFVPWLSAAAGFLCPRVSVPPWPVVKMHECSRVTSGFLVVW